MNFMRMTCAVLVAGVLFLLAFNTLWALGFALGGFAGLAGFWILHRQAQKARHNAPADLQFHFMKGAMLRLPLYVVLFYAAYRIDSETRHPLFAALGGYFIARAVVMFHTLSQTKH